VQRDNDAIRKSIEAEFDNASVSIVLASKGESLDEPVMATAAQAAA
jgi:hypothetical protein